MQKKFSDKKAQFLQALHPRRNNREGGSSGGGTPTTTRPTTPTPAADLGLSIRVANPGAVGVAQASTGAQDKTLTTDQNVLEVTSGVSSIDSHDSPTILLQVRDWWKAHRSTVLASAQFVLESVEKGLDGMPIPGPKAAIGAFAGVVNAVRTLDENNASVEEIAEKVEELTSTLAQFMAPTVPDLTTASVSEDMRKRVEEFNERLTKIKMSASAHPTTWKNVLVRLADAERASGELKDVWTKIQLEYLHLITMTGLSTERKVDEVQRRLLLDRLKPALSSLYDDAEAAPSCLEETRVDLLAHIEEWMADPSGKPVYWLTGVAGTGKTTIAQSVAIMADAKDRRRLFGSFFFSRTGAVDRRSAAAVIPTLVYQLALKNGVFCSRLCEAIDSEPDIFRKKVEVQTKTLLSDTCSTIPARFPHPLVIVVDALDECDKQQGIEGGNLIPVLLGALQDLPFCVKIFITSRPESSIENMFSRGNLRNNAEGLALHRDVEDSIVRNDIGRYLRHGLDKLSVDHPQVTVPPSFPLEAQFAALQDRAGTLFIYARTALEFISNPHASPRRQIELLLSADSRKAARGFGTLDDLYKHILSEALQHGPGTEPREVLDVLGSLVLLRENFPVASLAALNGIEDDDCRAIVRSLTSVLLYDRELAGPIRPIHLSFSDFLLDRSRSTDAYVVDESAHHLRIAERCLQIMNECLQMDICDIRDSSLFNSEVADLQQRLSNCVPPHLRYSCRYWYVHLQMATTLPNTVVACLDEFCHKHLLHWIELLSLLEELPVVLPSLPSFLAYLHGFDGMQDTYALLSDIVRFAAAYQIPVTASALHVYHSAVVTMPSCQLQKLASKDNLLPVLISERSTSWPTSFEGHTSCVACVAFSSDGKYIVSGSVDSTVRLWDTATGIQLRTMPDHEDIVNSLAVFSDSQKLRVVSASRDCTVRVWDALTGAQLRTIHHEQAVNCVAFSRDGELIVSGSDYGIIRVWDTPTATLQLVWNGHNEKVHSVTFSSDSKLVVSGSADCTLRVWDAATGMQRLVISGHNGPVTYVAFPKDSKFIVSGARFDTVRIWSSDTGTLLCTTAIQEGGDLSVAVSRDESLIASASFNDLNIRLWDATTGHLQRLIETGLWTGHTHRITSVATSDDGKFLAVGYENGPLWVSDITTPADVQQRSQTGHMLEITVVAFSGDGMFVVSGANDCTVKVWSAKTGVELSTMSGHTHAISSVALSRDGKLGVSGSYDSTVRLWESETGTELYVLDGHEGTVLSVALSGDDKLIALGSRDHTVRVWDVATGTHLYTMDGHEGSVTSVAFSDDSSLIISGSKDGTIRTWDAATGTHKQIITGHQGGSVAFSDNRSSVFSRSIKTGTMRVWEASTVIAADGASLPQYIEAPDSPRCDRFKLGHDDDGWISRISTRNSWQRLCWLPGELRGDELAYHGQTVCIGAKSGAITILDFSRVITP